MLSPFQEGGLAALRVFREKLIENRDEIENQSEPAFDVILKLLDDTAQFMEAFREDGNGGL